MKQNPLSKDKLTALLLALLLCAPIFASCGSDTSPAETVGEAVGEAAAAPAAEAEPEEETSYTADYLPDVTYDGYEYRIIEYNEYPLHQEEVTGSVIDDAIYERNLLAEEKFDINITATQYPYANWSEVGSLLRQAGMAQTDDYDLYFVVFADAYTALTEGAVPPASSLPYTDPSQPWYYHAINEGMNINGIMLMAYTAFDKNPGGKCLVFNQAIFDDIGEEYPYQMVDNGTWTYDQFYTLIEKAAMDLDEDGKVSEADQFGFITSTDDYTDFTYYGSGLKLVDFSEGEPVINQNEQLFDMFLKSSEYLGRDYVVLDVYDFYGWVGDAQDKGVDVFTAGNAMFAQTNISNLVRLGDMEDDYGIVPYPKWTESQSQYYCGMDGSRISVPCTASADLERVCIIKEYLSVESLNINYPAYYEVSLKNRYVRDQDSIRMMEIVTNGTTYDVGAAMDYTGVRGPWMTCLENRDTAFASAVSANLTKAQAVLKKLNRNIDKLKELYP